MAAWHEDDAFWTALEAVLFNARRYADAPAEVARLIQLLDLAPEAAVLDLPCGPGRHALELARRGFRVTGVDRTAAFVTHAQQQAACAGLVAEWRVEDMRTFRRPGAFDVVLNLFTSFGYFADAADDRRVLENLFASLRPGGRLVLDLLAREILARIFIPRTWERLPDGRLFLEERTMRDDWSWVDICWTLIDGGQQTQHTLGHRCYSAAELKALLVDVGFRRVHIHGSFEGTPYDRDARRLVIVAQK